MSSKTFFTPGPSQLYPTVSQHIQQALEDDIASISHRSQLFKDIYKETTDALKELIGLPEGYHIFFTGSATEIWERILRNTVTSSSFHFVNGSFSKRFYEYSVMSGLSAGKLEAPFSHGFDINEAQITAGTELICVTQNETSSGVQFPVEDIYSLRAAHPDALIAVDVVSSLPQPVIDYNQVDTALFSVQKCFGLPAGLGVWLVNERMINKANSLVQQGVNIGPHHDIPELLKRELDNQTPSTPNILSIYLLGKVCQDMLKKGVDVIRQETMTKFEMINDFVKQSDIFDISVENPAHRSETVIVANSKLSAGAINEKLAAHQMAIGAGYGKYKSSQVRIANFPAHSVEATEKLIELLKYQESYA